MSSMVLDVMVLDVMVFVMVFVYDEPYEVRYG